MKKISTIFLFFIIFIISVIFVTVTSCNTQNISTAGTNTPPAGGKEVIESIPAEKQKEIEIVFLEIVESKEDITAPPDIPHYPDNPGGVLAISITPEATVCPAGTPEPTEKPPYKFDKSAVPYLIDQLKNTELAYKIIHPGGHDDCGMPLVGWDEEILVRDIAKEELKKIYSEDTEGDTYSDYARKYVVNFIIDDVLKDVDREAIPDDIFIKASYILKSMGEIKCYDARIPLEECFHAFMERDKDWKWAYGRELIGSTLSSLSVIGNEETGRIALQYMQDPGCDFLYRELKGCIDSLGKFVIPEIIEAIREEIEKKPYSPASQPLIETLGNSGSKDAVAFLMKLLDLPDEKDVMNDNRRAAIQSLGQLKAEEAAEKIAEIMVKNNNFKSESEQALINIYADRDNKELTKILKEGKGNYRSIAAASVLGSRGEKEELDVLQGELKGAGKEYEAVLKEAIDRIKARLEYMNQQGN